MDLWIRTQSKEQLLLAQEIKLQINTYDGECQILIANKHTYHYAGKYKTKERALEILDEIQKLIQPTFINTKYNCEIKDGPNKTSFDLVMQPDESKIEIIQPTTLVYELPKE